MKGWKLALAIAAMLLALWWLNPERAIEPAERDVVEITYLAQSGPESSSLEEAMRVFEHESREQHARDPSHPIYRVVTGQNASRDQTADPTRFLVSVAGGAPPDLIRFDRYAVSEWAARGAFAKLDEFVARDANSTDPAAVRADNFYKSCWDEVVYEHPLTHERGVYAIPADVDDRALFYNKDILKRAGYVDANGEARPPRTWDELEEMAAKLTDHDASGRITRLGFAPNYGNAWLYLYTWMLGGEFISPDGKRCTLNSPFAAQALEWMTRVYDSIGGAQRAYAFQGDTAAGQRAVPPGEVDPFVLGRVAMKIDGYWNFPEVLAQYGRDVNYGVAPPPMPAGELAKGRQPMSWVSGWCYAIPSTARQKEGAWELLRFLCSQRAIGIVGENERLRLGSIGRVYVPTQNSNRKTNEWLYQTYVASNPAIQPKIRDGAKLLDDLLEVSPIRPVTPVGQLLFNEQRRATENAIFHKMSAQSALDGSTRVVQQALDHVLYPRRGPLVPWRFFVGGYLALLAAGAAVLTRKSRVGKSFEGWIAASPWLIGFVTLIGGPIVFAIIISFCDYDILNPARFVGLTNYRAMLSDPLLGKAIGNTAYMIVGIPFGMALSLAMALALNQRVRGVAVWRTAFFLPSIVPAVAASILWLWILNPNVGLLNNALAAFGISGPDWLQNEHASKPALILMGLWSAGGGMIIWLAGLKAISTNCYEAAALDGANAWQRFRYVTLPLLTPYILFNCVMGLIATLQIFTQAFILTQGGPVDSTLFYAYHLFNHAFRFLNMGYAAALGWFLFLAVFGLTILQLRLSKRWVHYEE